MLTLRTWVAGLVCFMALDGLWLGIVMRGFYRDALSPIARLGSDGSLAPNWAAALPVYLLLVAGLALFVLPRAGLVSTSSAACWGALFGALTYGVYDLTNLATLRGYPTRLAVVDILWGATASAIVATVMQLVARSSGGI